MRILRQLVVVKRGFSSVTVSERPSKLENLLHLTYSIIPGATPFKKTLTSTALLTLSTLLHRAGIYHFDGESLTAISFILLCRLAYLKAGKPLADYLDQEREAEEQKWYADRTAEKTKYSTQLGQLQNFLDYPRTVQILYDLQAANVQLADLVKRAQSKFDLYLQVSQAAQDLVKKEQQRLLAEAREERVAMMRELQQLLADPQVQKRIMEKCLNDLKTLPVKQLS